MKSELKTENLRKVSFEAMRMDKLPKTKAKRLVKKKEPSKRNEGKM